MPPISYISATTTPIGASATSKLPQPRPFRYFSATSHLGPDADVVQLHVHQPVLDNGVCEPDGCHVVEHGAGKQVLVARGDGLAAVRGRDVDPEHAWGGQSQGQGRESQNAGLRLSDKLV